MRRRLGICVVVAASLSTVSCDRLYENHHPVCDVRSPTILMAESVKTASMIPCVRALPAGWRFGSFGAHDGEATFSLDADAGGDRAVAVTLQSGCEPTGTEADSGVSGARLTREVTSTDPYAARWTYRFRGGCAVLAIAFVPGAPVRTLLHDLRTGLSFLPRSEIAAALERRQGSRLDPVTA